MGCNVWKHTLKVEIPFLTRGAEYSLDFLTEQDKRDILYNNAAKFLRLKE
jgi:predicted TIM-barrel fold metal-dependent hydrolase